MPQFLITALDYTDAQALDRRMATRPAHLEMAKKLKESGNFLLGGAMLNEEEKMIGSTLVLEFDSREQIDQWLAHEPYMLQKVWEKVEVTTFKVANI
ncbi:hypothetical protein EFA69_05305 [Rufibacter immobilis]|uniref:YCII-related domain-containing protein n=1 Tax=Rufibacter immobilis TaxID=1348778 RepID=A0A3M9N4J6_9BACT|nr:YciI family protein [Rufibacter immobilis]RNI31928.1 hypothetical protein EFA69_05305 [Rufibacter immobilis]